MVQRPTDSSFSPTLSHGRLSRSVHEEAASYTNVICTVVDQSKGMPYNRYLQYFDKFEMVLSQSSISHDLDLTDRSSIRDLGPENGTGLGECWLEVLLRLVPSGRSFP